MGPDAGGKEMKGCCWNCAQWKQISENSGIGKCAVDGQLHNGSEEPCKQYYGSNWDRVREERNEK